LEDTIYANVRHSTCNSEQGKKRGDESVEICMLRLPFESGRGAASVSV